MFFKKELTLKNFYVICLAFILIFFGQGIAYQAISIGANLFNVEFSLIDVFFLLQNMAWFGLVPQGIGVSIMLFYTFRFRLRIKKQLFKSIIITSVVCAVFWFSFFSAPLVQANIISASIYYFKSPLPVASVYVGQYSNSSYFAIDGKNWTNFIVNSSKNVVLQTAVNSISSGIVYLDDVTWDYASLTVPQNIVIEEHMQGVERKFGNIANSQSSPYRISVGSGRDIEYYFVEDSTGTIFEFSKNFSSIMQKMIDLLQVQGVENGRYSGEIILSSGVFSYSTGLIINCQFAGLMIKGQGGGTVLSFSGSGSALNLTGNTERNTFKDFQILLSGNSTFGIQLQTAHKNSIDNLIIRGTSPFDGRTGICVGGESHWNNIENTYVLNIQKGIDFAKVDGGYPIFNSVSKSQIRECEECISLAGQNIGISDTALEQFQKIGLHVEDSGSGAYLQNLYEESYYDGAIGIFIDSGARGIFYQGGTINLTNGTRITDNGIGPNTWMGEGYVNEWCVNNVQNGIKLEHGLLGIPTSVSVTLLTGNDCLPENETIICWVLSEDETTITIGARWLNGTALTEDGHTAFIKAFYQP